MSLAKLRDPRTSGARWLHPCRCARELAPWPRMGRKAILFERIRGSPTTADTCRRPRMPAILEGARIPGYARPGGWIQAGSGSMGMDERPRYERRSGGGASREKQGCIPGCGDGPLLSVFQARCFSRIGRSSGREPCISIIRPGDCEAGPITATS